MLSLFALLFLLKLKSIFLEITIPFTTIKENITTETPSTFMFFYFPNKIEALVNIGTPFQEIPLRIKTMRSPISINSVKMGTYKVIRFNESNSASYIPLTENSNYFGENDFNQAIKSKDIITFNNNSLILNNFTFCLGVRDNQYYKEGGVLGFNIAEFDWRIKDVGFIKQLKERKLIKRYIYYIKYNENNEDGEVIIDALPHEINSKKFDENKYDKFLAENVSSTLGIKVKEAYYGETLVDCEFKVELAIEENFIRGTDIFKESLFENFFKDKITRKICQKSIFSYIDNENLEFFYCSRNLNIYDFKPIILSIYNSELKIELTFNDLFYIYGDNYYFLMYFPTKSYSNTYFRLGKFLFQKYTLIINHDSRMIGYYKTNNKGKNEKEKSIENNKKIDFKKFIPWIIVGVLGFIVLLLIFYIIYYKPCKNRTKRANELIDDNYSYEGINNS